MQFAKFLLSRLFSYLLVVWISITIVFFVPRFIPGNPVEAMLGKPCRKARRWILFSLKRCVRR